MEGGGTVVFGHMDPVQDPGGVPMRSRCRVVTGGSKYNVGKVDRQDDGDQGCLVSIGVQFPYSNLRFFVEKQRYFTPRLVPLTSPLTTKYPFFPTILLQICSLHSGGEVKYIGYGI